MSGIKTLPIRGIQKITSENAAISVSITDAGQATVNLDGSKIMASTSTQVTKQYIAGENLAALKAVFVHTDGKVYMANNSSLQESGVVGITKNAATLGDEITVIQYGIIQDSFFATFSQGDVVILGSYGTLTNQANENGYLTRLGRCISQYTLLLLIETPISL